MGQFTLPRNMDVSRYSAFRQPDLTEVAPDYGFDHLTTLAADVFDVPIALISLIDGDNHTFISSLGAPVTTIPARVSFCDHTLRLGDILVVPDALRDARFAANPFVLEAPHVRFYAGAPLRYEGQLVGSLCVLDTQPREDFDAKAISRLRKMADSVSSVLSLCKTDALKKTAIRKLQETQRKLELMEEVAGIGYWHLHAETQACFWSRGTYAIHGVDPAGFQPAIDTAIDFFHPDDRDSVRTCVGHALLTGQDFTFEARLVRGDGEERIVYAKGGAQLDEDGATEFIFGILQDVTEQARFEDTLRTAKENAEAHQRAKSDFLSNMSHEIRTPLTTILGYATVLNKLPDLPKEARHCVTRIDKAGEALQSLITDILDFSKLEAGQVELDPQATDLRSLVTDIVHQFDAMAESRELDLGVHYADTAPAWLMLDDLRLRQVLYNLVGNACKFTQSGFVHVEAGFEAGRLHVEIRDSGPGLTPEQQARLFTRFNQIDNSINRKFGGSGLGLSICAEIVKLMRGEIGVVSQPGHGSTFWFDIPVETTTAPIITASVEDLQPVSHDGCKVLVVDDHPVNRELIRLLLASSGLDFYEACDGRAAVEICDQIQFDLIFMDIQMPVMDGLIATRHLRDSNGLNRATPIVALSAAAQTKLIDDTNGRGFTGVLTKPIDMTQFFNTLNRCLEGPAAPQRLAS